MEGAAWAFASRSRYERAQRLARAAPAAAGARRERSGGCRGPFSGWTATRDLAPVAEQTFREWWRERGA